MTSDDRDGGLRRILCAGDVLDESLGTHDVKRGDAEQLLRVEFAVLGEDLGGDRDCGVDGVGDDEDVGFWAVVCYALDESLNDAGVDLEEVVAGHSWLACVLSQYCNPHI